MNDRSDGKTRNKRQTGIGWILGKERILEIEREIIRSYSVENSLRKNRYSARYLNLGPPIHKACDFGRAVLGNILPSDITLGYEKYSLKGELILRRRDGSNCVLLSRSGFLHLSVRFHVHGAVGRTRARDLQFLLEYWCYSGWREKVCRGGRVDCRIK